MIKKKVEEQLKEEKRELEKQITELTIKQTISKEAKEQMIAKLGQPN
ncbi:hypothetical protein KHA80_21645 [Anaerobacillus sp. HL2]|nr:hypothetical protein KHA80_21645 [Anaerobacillus sp. HL2]